MECLKCCLLCCTGLSAGPELQHSCLLAQSEKEREDKEETPPPPTLFLCTVMSLSFSFVSLLSVLFDLNSKSDCLTVFYHPLLKPWALCLSAGLILNWTRHYPSLSNAQTHPISLE